MCWHMRFPVITSSGRGKSFIPLVYFTSINKHERCDHFLILLQTCVPLSSNTTWKELHFLCVLSFFLSSTKTLNMTNMSSLKNNNYKTANSFSWRFYHPQLLGSRFALTAYWNECNSSVILRDNNILRTVGWNISSSIKLFCLDFPTWIFLPLTPFHSTEDVPLNSINTCAANAHKHSCPNCLKMMGRNC